MKISEVRRTIDGYSADQLRLVIARMYTAIPKAVKEEKGIDSILQDPDASAQPRANPKGRETPDIDLLTYDTDSFLEDAYNLYYFAPNRFVPKRDRPKWRFIVKRLYKDILACSADETNLTEAAQLLEKLYRLLCDSCSRMLFSSEDPFASVGIEQDEFFRKVLAVKYQCEDKNSFIKNALLSMLNDHPGSETQRENLMHVILEFARTPDLKEMTLACCSELIEAINSKRPSRKDHEADYEKREKLASLAKMGFLCYARLHELPNAISYFKQSYPRGDGEAGMYVLLKLLFAAHRKDYFVQEYEQALARGVTPRDTIRRVYEWTKEKGELPATAW